MKKFYLLKNFNSIQLKAICCFVVSGVLFVDRVFSQSSPQDCINAITVCTNTYVQNSNFSGFGSIQEITVGGNTCFVNGETNSSWYLFKIKNPGTLLLEIAPMNLSDDYDFLIYNFSNDSCQGILSGLSVPVRCNYSSSQGITGLASGYSFTNVNASGPAFCSPLQVLTDETYMLMVNNFTATTSGYTLTFSGSATIYDTDAPALDSATTPTCSPHKVTVYFSENVDPASLAANGSDFIVTGPSAAIVSDATLITNNSVRIRFSSPITVPGTYTVRIKQGTDGNTLSDFCSNAIAVNKSINFNIQFIGPVASISSIQDADCNGNNGSATGSYSGGTGPYSFLWNTVPPQYNITATNLSPGNYSFSVTDANGCTSIETFNIIATGKPQVSITKTDELCGVTGSGQASAVVTGGTIPYSYIWSTLPPQTTLVATGLTAGSYTFTVTDNNGCSATETVTIDLTGAPVIQFLKTDVSCDGSIGGTATANVSGNAPFTYLWSNSQTTAGINSLSQGTYTVTVTDILGCTKKSNVTISTGQIQFIVTVTDVACGNQNTGSASVIVTGAIPPFTYSWNTVPVQNASVAVNLSVGTYQVVVIDSAGCKDSVSVIINGPPAITLTVSSNNANCNQNDGSASVIVSGGVQPYSYLWNTFPTQLTNTAVNLTAGIYNIVVTDDEGCTESASVYVNNINGPDGFISFKTDATCNEPNGSATASIINGVGPFTYEWNTTPPQFDSIAFGLAEGIYYVRITDINGCISFLNVKINVIEMVTLLTGSVNDASCGKADGSASVIDSGGVGPFTFQWLTNPVQTGATANNLSAGTYLAIVTDGNGCKDSVEITVGETKANNDIDYKVGCLNEPTLFEGITDYNGSVTWQWDFGDPFNITDISVLQNPSYVYNTTGPFTVTLYILGGCATDTIIKQINTAIKPIASFITDPEKVFAQAPVTFVYTGTPVEKWFWYFGDGTTYSNPAPIYQFTYSDSVQVVLMVTDQYGCKDTVMNEFFVEEAPQIFSPNCFTPNGDGVNDHFRVVANGLAQCDVKVFSRWGDMVFHTDNKNLAGSIGWDGKVNGKAAIEGIYVYVITGKLLNNKPFYKTGNINVLY